MLYLIENRNQAPSHLKKLLDTIKPLVIFTSPSLSALTTLQPHTSDGPVQDYTAEMELASPFNDPKLGPKILNEAGLAVYSLMRQAGSIPNINETGEEVYFRVERWFKLWRTDWDQTPHIPVVIFADSSIFDVVHSVIDSNTPGRFEINKGTYGSIMAYNNDGWIVTTVKQLQ
jgi:hypothetical protein